MEERIICPLHKKEHQFKRLNFKIQNFWESHLLPNTTSGTRTQTPLLEADLKSAAPANYAKVAKNVRYGIWTHVTALKGQCPIPLD